MSKRKLSNQQADRIQKNQQKEVALSGPEQTGQVIAHYGQVLEIKPLDSFNSQTISAFARQNLGPLATGDFVIFQMDEKNEKTSQAVITACLPRKSLIQRPDIYKGSKIIAANIDQILIVIAVNPRPIEHALDRALITAYNQNIPAVLILNKTDLIHTSENTAFFDQLTKRYEKIGYEVIPTSAKMGKLENLENKIKDKTNLFVGASGVGKSSLINALFDTADLAKTGEISEANLRGKHTTTTARLYQKQNSQTQLVDAPGIREFGLWDLTPEALLNGFIEFKPFLNQCQFRNCDHQANSKGCAIQQALVNGEISPERMQSYLRLRSEIKNNS